MIGTENGGRSAGRESTLPSRDLRNNLRQVPLVSEVAEKFSFGTGAPSARSLAISCRQRGPCLISPVTACAISWVKVTSTSAPEAQRDGFTRTVRDARWQKPWASRPKSSCTRQVINPQPKKPTLKIFSSC